MGSVYEKQQVFRVGEEIVYTGEVKRDKTRSTLEMIHKTPEVKNDIRLIF